MSQEQDIKKVAELLGKTKKAVALTGAGISVESGIPAFRGSQGLWEKWDPRIFEISFFRKDPVQGWQLLMEMDKMMMDARPNQGHLSLVELERMGILQAIITQNIDGLHHEAGSRDVVEFHGNARRLRCLKCTKAVTHEQVSFDPLPPYCSCGGVIKPDIVFFGEAIPQDAGISAYTASQHCEVMLVIGTSAVVAPASHLPVMAKQCGATVVEINMEPSALGNICDYVLIGSAGEVLPQIISQIKAS